MPIYEFYCVDCHTVFNFFSRRINTEKQPNCPRCGRPRIDRRLSTFAISKGRREDAEDGLADIDDDRMERALAAMAGEMENVDEEDPRGAARMMRKLFDASGLSMGSGMEEAIRRMEAGEDPDQIEAEMGDILEHEDPFAPKATGTIKDLRRRYLPPSVDKTLYDL
jgi:putative FmdB family regulatory protein